MKSFLIGLFGLTLFPAIGAVCWYTDHFGAFLAVMFVLFLFSGDRTPTGGRDVGRRSATSAWPERSSNERTKPKSKDRLVELRIEHLGQPLQNGRAIVAGRELTRHIVAHGLKLPPRGKSACPKRGRSGPRASSLQFNFVIPRPQIRTFRERDREFESASSSGEFRKLSVPSVITFHWGKWLRCPIRRRSLGRTRTRYQSPSPSARSHEPSVPPLGEDCVAHAPGATRSRDNTDWRYGPTPWRLRYGS